MAQQCAVSTLLRVGNTRRKDLLEWFERLLPLIEEKLASGELLVELT